MTASARVDEWAQDQLETWHIPGMVIGVYRNGKPEHVAAYGHADLEHDVPMKRESVCEICSITKQFTATCMLLLQEAGKLSIDHPVSKYIEAMPAPWMETTLAEVMHHISGINDDAFDLNEHVLTREVLAKAASTVVRGRREAWEYSNLGYRLLGDVVSVVAQAPYFEFLADRILKPLGLTNTRPNSSEIIPNRVRGYGIEGGKLVNTASLTDLVGGGTGGLASTVDDLSRWSTALMNGEVLTPESRALMLTPGLLSSGDVARPPASPGGYGLGVNVSTVSGRLVEKHAGGWSDASAQLTRLPDDQLTVAILTNFGGWMLRPWVGEIVASMFVPGFKLPMLECRPDPNPARLAKLAAFLTEIAAGPATADHASAKLLAQIQPSIEWWRDEFKQIDVGRTQFVESVPQGPRELIFYRCGGESPLIVTTGFAADGKLDSLSIGPVPE